MMFGDGPNDSGNLDYVGLKIAMGNATPELKEKADYVTGTIEEDGIFNALRTRIGRKRISFPQLDLDTVQSQQLKQIMVLGHQTLPLSCTINSY